MRCHRSPRPLPRLLAIVACLAAAAGCAGTGALTYEWTYEKRGATTAQVDRDMNACRKEATARTGLSYAALTGPDLEVYNDCMRKRGYAVTKP